MCTLYVSDLDGTLLRSDQRISEYTNHVINELVGNGMVFPYAAIRLFICNRKMRYKSRYKICSKLIPMLELTSL